MRARPFAWLAWHGYVSLFEKCFSHAALVAVCPFSASLAIVSACCCRLSFSFFFSFFPLSAAEIQSDLTCLCKPTGKSHTIASSSPPLLLLLDSFVAINPLSSPLLAAPSGTPTRSHLDHGHIYDTTHTHAWLRIIVALDHLLGPLFDFNLYSVQLNDDLAFLLLVIIPLPQRRFLLPSGQRIQYCLNTAALAYSDIFFRKNRLKLHALRSNFHSPAVPVSRNALLLSSPSQRALFQHILLIAQQV